MKDIETYTLGLCAEAIIFFALLNSVNSPFSVIILTVGYVSLLLKADIIYNIVLFLNTLDILYYMLHSNVNNFGLLLIIFIKLLINLTTMKILNYKIIEKI